MRSGKARVVWQTKKGSKEGPDVALLSGRAHHARPLVKSKRRCYLRRCPLRWREMPRPTHITVRQLRLLSSHGPDGKDSEEFRRRQLDPTKDLLLKWLVPEQETADEAVLEKTEPKSIRLRVCSPAVSRCPPYVARAYRNTRELPRGTCTTSWASFAPLICCVSSGSTTYPCAQRTV